MGEQRTSTDLFDILDCQIKNIVEIISESIKSGATWDEMRESYTDAMVYNISVLSQSQMSATTSDEFLNTGFSDFNPNSYLKADCLQSELETNPVIYAINTDNEKLFDMLSQNYSNETLDGEGVLKTAILSQDGKYLERIKHICDKEQRNDYFGNNRDVLFDAFNTHCEQMRHNRTPENYEKAIKLFELCPDAHTYQDNERRSFLRLAVENVLDDVTAYLIQHKCNPTATMDVYDTQTIYDYAFLKSKHRPKHQRWQNIMQSLRDGIPADKKKFWQEKEVFLSNKDEKSHKADRTIVTSTVILLAVVAFCLSKCSSAMLKKLPEDSKPNNVLNTTAPQRVPTDKKQPPRPNEQHIYG